jgi:ankyrin repeat protein
MDTSAAELLEAAGAKKAERALSKSAEVDALVKELRAGSRQARMEMKRMLTAGKISASTIDDHGCPLVHSVCQGNMYSFLFDLVQVWQADLSLVDELGNTCMHVCHYFGGGEWTRLWSVLEEAYCDDTALNALGLQATEMTGENIAKQIFRLLAVDLEEDSTSVGKTKKVGARKRGEDITIKAISRKFISGHERDEHGRTILMYAAGAGSSDLVQLMFKVKCEKDAQDADGNTACHHAVLRNQEFIAAVIVRKGADTRMRNAEGKTAMQVRKDAHPPEQDTAEKAGASKKPPQESAHHLVEEERSEEMEELYNKFLKAASSESGLGLGNARTGRSSSTLPGLGDEKGVQSLARNKTLNYSELLSFLRTENLMPSPVNSTLASNMFRKVNKQFARERGFEPGEMHWPHFKQVLRHIADEAALQVICGVPLEQFKLIVPSKSKEKLEWDDWNLSSHSKDALLRDINWMQRQVHGHLLSLCVSVCLPARTSVPYVL